MGEGRRVAILGGGMGALTTAYYLTDPKLATRFEVTVYTMGWRLGGKGASGRNADRKHRVEEHGFHLWFGTYHNAIRMMKEVYAELGRPPDAKLATFLAAFKPQNRVVLMEEVRGTRLEWPIIFPEGPDDGATRTVWDFLDDLTDVITTTPMVADSLAAAQAGLKMPPPVAATLGGLGLMGGNLAATMALSGLRGMGGGARLRILDLGPDLVAEALKWLAKAIWLGLSGHDLEQADWQRRFWIAVYLSITIARGILRDRLYEHGFDAVDAEELQHWLARHSSFPGTTEHEGDSRAFRSPCVSAFYEASFSYAGGNPKAPFLAASSGLRNMLRVLLDYRGSIVLEMQSGMGDAVFAPLYEVLCRRKVRFEFFSRVTGISVDAQRRVEAVEISRQVKVKAPPYRPLTTVDGLRVWPNKPDAAQIRNGKSVATEALENWNGPDADCGSHKIQRHSHFDELVLATSHATLRYITDDLMRTSRRWRRMVEGLASVATQAWQLWFVPSRAALGRTGDPEIIGSFDQPWACQVDFTHIVPTEAWGAAKPGYLAYSCGPLPDADTSGRDAVFDRLKEFVGDSAPIWPLAHDASGTFDPAVLWDPANGAGEARLAAQYWRSNDDPASRYVTAVPGSAARRLAATESGFDGLYLAGEWVETGLGISSIESTVISGMQAAQAIRRVAIEILGDNDL